MNSFILLNHKKGFAWESENDMSAKGYGYTQEGKFLKAGGLLQSLLPALQNEEIMIATLKALNGVFSWIYASGSDVYLYCDKSRFFPLFFRLSPELLISDDPETLIREGDSLDEFATEEFRCTGYTTGLDTLVSEIRQIPAGELLIISQGGNIKRHRIFSYQVRLAELRTYKDPLDTMHAAIEKAALKFVQSLGESTPIIPLSGGYDSRLIACILKNYGYSNSICFTYGRKTEEVEISRKVADLLGFKWYFIDYEIFENERLSIKNEVFNSYYRYTSKFTSMFYLQEYPAILYLLENNLIPNNSIFLPGHSGDLLGGSQFDKVFPVHLGIDKIAEQILATKYFNYPAGSHLLNFFRKRLELVLDKDNSYLGYSIFEDWDIREKIAKFIINSSQLFTFFGFQVRFFYWDNELVEFFRFLPPEYKSHKQMYDCCLKEKYFEKYDLNFDRELTLSRIQLIIQKLKNRLKPYLPRSVMYKYILKNDWACYEKLTRLMLNEIDPVYRKKLPYYGFNSVIINWYLAQVTVRLSKSSNSLVSG